MSAADLVGVAMFMASGLIAVLIVAVVIWPPSHRPSDQEDDDRD